METYQLIGIFLLGWAAIAAISFAAGRLIRSGHRADQIEAAYMEGFIAGKQEANTKPGTFHYVPEDLEEKITKD